jgi:thiol-disulfide isomerase/thioredoxin
MDTIKKMKMALGKNSKFIIILLLALVFLIAAFYVFKKYVLPLNNSFKPNNEFPSSNTDETTEEKYAIMYMFKVDWCPHCKKALPIWEKIVADYQDKIIKGYIMDFKLIDGEEDAETTDKFNVEGYPTIKMIKDDQIIEYDAKPDYDTIVQFMQSTL